MNEKATWTPLVYANTGQPTGNFQLQIDGLFLVAEYQSKELCEKVLPEAVEAINNYQKPATHEQLTEDVAIIYECLEWLIIQGHLRDVFNDLDNNVSGITDYPIFYQKVCDLRRKISQKIGKV